MVYAIINHPRPGNGILSHGTDGGCGCEKRTITFPWEISPSVVDSTNMLSRIRTVATDTFCPNSWQTTWHPIRERQETEEINTHEKFERHSERLQRSKCPLSRPWIFLCRIEDSNKELYCSSAARVVDLPRMPLKCVTNWAYLQGDYYTLMYTAPFYAIVHYLSAVDS